MKKILLQLWLATLCIQSYSQNKPFLEDISWYT